MKELIRASMMVMGILVAMGCQKNMPEETEGAETMGVDPDGQTPPPSPKDVHGTVTASVWPMIDLTVYIYDCYGVLILARPPVFSYNMDMKEVKDDSAHPYPSGSG